MLGEAAQEVPARSSHLLHHRPPHQTPVDDEQPGGDLRPLEFHQQVAHRPDARSVPPVGKVPPEHPVVAADHRPHVHLGAVPMVRVPPGDGEGAGRPEEQHVGQVIGEDLACSLRERVELAPPAAERLLQLGDMFDDLGHARVVVADQVEGAEEGVLGEGVGRRSREKRKVGGGSPALQAGGGGGIEDAMEGPGGEETSCRGARILGIPATHLVDRGGKGKSSREPRRSRTAPA